MWQSARSRPEAGELDDTMSETSSVSSERSHGSYGKMSEVGAYWEGGGKCNVRVSAIGQNA